MKGVKEKAEFIIAMLKAGRSEGPPDGMTSETYYLCRGCATAHGYVDGSLGGQKRFAEQVLRWFIDRIKARPDSALAIEHYGEKIVSFDA